MAEFKDTYTVEAILKARDAGYFSTLDKAAGKASSFKDTMMGMSAAQLAMKGLSKTWDLVSSSVGSAMGRIDTMEQFNRTMQLMTGDSKMAADALARVNDSVKGTAYGLDVASSAVQGFVSSGKDVNASIDMVSNWGDALALFGQASNENLSIVSIALQKMGNSGKVSMENLRMLTDRGIPALEIFAEATGKTTAEVSEQMSKGKLSAQEFFDVMNRAFTEGTERFPAVVGAAKEAGSSWSATFDNMRAAVTRGVQSIITSIEDGRAKSDLPGMKNAVSDFGKNIEGALKTVSKATGFAAEHFETFASIAETAIAGIAAHKAWESIRTKLAEKKTAAISAQNAFNLLAGSEKAMLSISGLYANALADESNAEKMRNAAMKYGLLVNEEGNIVRRNGKEITEAQKAALLSETGAVTANTIAHAVLTGQMKLATGAQLLFNQAVKANPIGLTIAGVTAAIKVFKLITNWINNSNKALQQAKKDAEAEAKALEDLNSKEAKFRNEFERTNKEIEKRKEKADKVIRSMQDIAKETGNAEEKTAKMSSKVSALQELYPDLVISVNAYQDALDGNVESLEKQVKALDQLSQIDVWKKHADDLANYREQMEIEMSIAEGLMKKMEEEGTNTELGFLGIRKETEEYAELKKQYEGMAEAYQRTGAEAEIAAEKIAEFDEQQVKSTLSAEQAKVALENLTTTYGISKEEAQAIIDYNKRMGESYDANAEAIMNLADKMGIGGDTVVSIMENMGQSAEELSQHYDSVYEHVSGIVNEMVEAADAGFGTIKQKEALSWDEIKTNLETNRQTMETWNENMEKLMIAGVDEGVIKHLQDMGLEGAQQAKALVDGLEAANGGVIEKGAKLTESAQAIVDDVRELFGDVYKEIEKSAETELAAEKYIEKGKQPIEGIIQGLSTGIVENEAKIKASGEKIMDNIHTAVKEGRKPIEKTFNETGEEIVKSVDKTGEDTAKSAEEGSENVQKKVEEGGEQITRSVKEISDDTLKEAEGLAKQLNDAFSTLPTDLFNAGEAAIQGLINGINSMSGSAYNAMANVARQVVAAYRAELQIHSPSKVMEKQGDYTMIPLLSKLKKGADEAANISRSIAENLRFQKDMPSMFETGIPAQNMERAASYNRPSATEPERRKTPAQIHVYLGGQEFTAFVSDIFGEHDNQLRLQGDNL